MSAGVVNSTAARSRLVVLLVRGHREADGEGEPGGSSWSWSPPCEWTEIEAQCSAAPNAPGLTRDLLAVSASMVKARRAARGPKGRAPDENRRDVAFYRENGYVVVPGVLDRRPSRASASSRTRSSTRRAGSPRTPTSTIWSRASAGCAPRAADQDAASASSRGSRSSTGTRARRHRPEARRPQRADSTARSST